MISCNIWSSSNEVQPHWDFTFKELRLFPRKPTLSSKQQLKYAPRGRTVCQLEEDSLVPHGLEGLSHVYCHPCCSQTNLHVVQQASQLKKGVGMASSKTVLVIPEQKMEAVWGYI
ncbi:hypothetical protein J6590_091522 [Homalodisca vitripennis]|nr:hypothetical protein J6590_091522 [Homalodisca vitripennis]